MADQFAQLAKPRLFELLKLKSAEHVYDPEPARTPANSVHQGRPVPLVLVAGVQPYKQIERFVLDDRIMSYIVDPGLIPIVKRILLDVRGRRWLVTRRVAATPGDKDAAVAHLDGVGLRVVVKVDAASAEAEVRWECLYGVA